MTDSYWIIEPLDGLVIGDGKPFDNTPGARLSTRPFPPPSVTTGGIRSRHAAAKGMSFDKLDQNYQSNIDELCDIEVAGPLLVELDSDGAIKTWFAPAPADASVYGDNAMLQVMLGTPQPLPPHIQTDLIDNLWIIKQEDSEGLGKKTKKPPLWWRWEIFEWWLTHPKSFQKTYPQIGHRGPANIVQTHVSIDPDTYGSREGFLFQTTHLDFRYTDDKQHGYFALLVRTSSEDLKPTMAPLGGERRLMHWMPREDAFPPKNEDIEKIFTSIAATGHCRVILLTPADWGDYQPDLKLDHWSHNGVTPMLKAIANDQPVVLSGWNFETNQPKPSRRLAPAGTVLFLELDGNPSQRHAWAEAMWMRCVSDNEQANRDGFGLAVVGTWNQGKELTNGS